MHKVKQLWFSPTLCGCVLDRTTVWSISAKIQARLAIHFEDDPEMADFWLQYLEEQGQYDHVETQWAVRRRCPEHAGLGADALAAELLAYGQNSWRPDTCGCSLCYWFDKRPPLEARRHVALEHPVYTERCAHHAHLGDAVEHLVAVQAENRRKNAEVERAALALGLEPWQVAWSFDSDRQVVVLGESGASVGLRAERHARAEELLEVLRESRLTTVIQEAPCG